jgi:glycosyltransferase involved in cell wall biosynthesis
MSKDTVTVVIPAFNEEGTIGLLLSKIKALHPDFQILVVDDGSTDNTRQVALDAGAEVIRHPYNIGNGAAVKSGIRAADGEVLVFMDGDGQHDPEDIQGLLQCIPEYDMAVGERTYSDQASIGRAVGNSLYNRLASYAANFPIRDLTSGFRAVKAGVARQFLYLLPNTYSYPTTLTLSVLRTGFSIKYVPIRIHRRRSGKSKINLMRDGVRFFMIIARICTLYSPMRIFLPVSFSIFCLGFAYYMYTFVLWRRFTNMSALLFSTSVIIFMLGLISEQITQMRFERREGRRGRP